MSLLIADELFFSGTAAEVTPIREVDNQKIGNGVPRANYRKNTVEVFPDCSR